MIEAAKFRCALPAPQAAIPRGRETLGYSPPMCSRPRTIPALLTRLYVSMT
jgi:hypothetical protein